MRPATSDSHPNKPMPPQVKWLKIDGAYTHQEYLQICQGFVPSTPNDKWFIYLADGWLNVHRSKAGTCIFQLELIPEEEHVSARRIKVNAHPKQYRSLSDEYDVQLLSYVIDVVLLGRFALFPYPKQFSKADQLKHQKHVMGESKKTISIDLLNGKK